LSLLKSLSDVGIRLPVAVEIDDPEWLNGPLVLQDVCVSAFSDRMEKATDPAEGAEAGVATAAQAARRS
jgi:hypothetical protein